MNNTPPNGDGFQKEGTVKIPLTIYTGYHARDEFHNANMQVELAVFHINAVAYFMKMTARGHILLDMQTENVLVDLSEFAANVEFGCQLIEGLTNAIGLPMIKIGLDTEKFYPESDVRLKESEQKGEE